MTAPTARFTRPALSPAATVDATAPAWRDRLATLLAGQHPSPLAPMGFSADWLARAVWR